MVLEQQQKKPAIFLDRDGVLNFDHGYVGDPSQMSLLPGVPEALKALAQEGYYLIMISNQSGVARGFFQESDVHACNQALMSLITQAGGETLHLLLFCPHHPEGIVEAYRKSCSCRKPEPGLILKAAETLPIDLSQSFMIGDKPDDVECAVRAGVRGIQICHPPKPSHPYAWAQVDSLLQAVPLILEMRKESSNNTHCGASDPFVRPK